MLDLRCARADRCEAREHHVDPTTGAPGMVGAETTGHALCDTCIRYLRYALGSLHWDITELTLLMRPSLQITYRDPDLPDQPRIKLHSPVPLNLAAEALRAYIDHETQVWAEAVVVETGADWDPTWAPMTRIGHRVQVCAALLDEHALTMIGLPADWRRTYNVTDDHTDGHDDDAIARRGHVLTTRSGVDAATSFFSIARQVRAIAGRVPSDVLHMRCPQCHHRLYREHFKAHADVRGNETLGRVVCRNRLCWLVLTDDEYDDLCTAVRSFGEAV